jgi:hypothetical protein
MSLLAGSVRDMTKIFVIVLERWFFSRGLKGDDLIERPLRAVACLFGEPEK